MSINQVNELFKKLCYREKYSEGLSRPVLSSLFRLKANIDRILMQEYRVLTGFNVF